MIRPRGIVPAVFAAALACAWLAGGAPVHPAGPEAGLVRIPAGPARLGSDDHEKGYGYVMGGAAAWRGQWFAGERARVERLPAYDIQATPVTQAAYVRFVAATGHRAPDISAAEYQAQGFLVHPYAQVQPYRWRDGRPPAARLEHPVVLVSHGDAGAYCRWWGQARQRSCHLPGEAEWEKAARGTDGRYYPWGNEWEPARANTQARGPGGTTPVRAHPEGRSPYGLYDMAGNVFEWTATPGRPGRYVLKGCSWDDLGGICRAAARHDRAAESRHILIGFRCACDVPHPTTR